MSSCDCPSCEADRDVWRREAKLAREAAERAKAQGLRNIGFAVAVWGAMAAARVGSLSAYVDGHCDGYAERTRQEKPVLDLAVSVARSALDLAENVRKRDLRLRWRRTHVEPDRRAHEVFPGDLLQWRAAVSKLDGRLFLSPPWRVRGIGFGIAPKRRPIAGPVKALPA